VTKRLDDSVGRRALELIPVGSEALQRLNEEQQHTPSSAPFRREQRRGVVSACSPSPVRMQGRSVGASTGASERGYQDAISQ
jgi:hypothetical protein